MNNNNYSTFEMRDMHFCYGQANGNARLARQLYEEAYPNRRVPHHTTFSTIHQRLGETGNLLPQRNRAGRPRTMLTVETEEAILENIENNPRTSVRIVSRAEGISKSSVHRVLKEQLLYPFHHSKVQALMPTDHEARQNFCATINLKIEEDPQFLNSILFTDEAGFGHDGLINLKNMHTWTDENPHVIVERGYQQKFSLNVWVGIVGDHLLGPHFFPHRLTGDIYLDFLRNDLPNLFDEVPVAIRREMVFMQDGAPPHFSLRVREYLDQTFPRRWIGRGGPIAWPPRSPDLNPLDFFLWGYLKTLIYQNPVQNVEHLRHKIIDACNVIRGKNGIFFRNRRSFRNRINLCLEMEGDHFENYL